MEENNIIFSTDKEENTQKLLSIKNLDSTIALSVGNVIFLNKNEYCDNSDFIYSEISLDEKKLIFVYPKELNDVNSRKIIPATNFTKEGIYHFFRYGGIPIEFKHSIKFLYEYNKDYNILKLIDNGDYNNE